jgi:uncharacterized membrane protein
VSERGLRLATTLLALAGLGIAAYLTYVRYAGAAIACSTGGCEKVQSSSYAELAGIPVAVIGLAGYAVIFATAFRAGELGALVAAALTLGGFAFAVYLVYVQLGIIDAVCEWCIASDSVMAALVVVSLLRVRAVSRATGVSAESPG